MQIIAFQRRLVGRGIQRGGVRRYCIGYGKLLLSCGLEMVLDLDLFREEKGGNPEKIRQNQKDRYKDVSLVNKVVDNDVTWRQCKFKKKCCILVL